MTINLTSPDAAAGARLVEFGAIARDMFSPALLADTAQRVLAMGERTCRCEAAGSLLTTMGGQQVLSSAASHLNAARADSLRVDTHQGSGQLPRSRRQHASIAVATAAERERLVRAVRTRSIVGQAQGLLMERHQITAERAATLLRHYPVDHGQELYVIAQRIVHQRAPSPARHVGDRVVDHGLSRLDTTGNVTETELP